MTKRFLDLPVKCRFYVVLIWLIAALFLVTAFAKLKVPNYTYLAPGELLFWASMVIFSESFLIYLPLSGYLSIGTAIDIPIILMFGPAVAALYGVLGAISALIVRRAPFYKLLFNMAQFILVLGISSWVYHSLAQGINFVENPSLIAVFALTVMIYFMLNSGLLSVAIGLSDGISPRSIGSRITPGR